jgi:hypothetical protein
MPKALLRREYENPVRLLSRAATAVHKQNGRVLADATVCLAGIRAQAFSATSTSSSIFLASPNSMRLFSL